MLWVQHIHICMLYVCICCTQGYNTYVPIRYVYVVPSNVHVALALLVQDYGVGMYVLYDPVIFECNVELNCRLSVCMCYMTQ